MSQRALKDQRVLWLAQRATPSRSLRRHSSVCGHSSAARRQPTGCSSAEPLSATAAASIMQFQRLAFSSCLPAPPVCSATARQRWVRGRALAAMLQPQEQRSRLAAVDGSSSSSSSSQTTSSSQTSSSSSSSSSRRSALLAAAALLVAVPGSSQAAAAAAAAAAAPLSAADIEQLEAEAYAAYADRDFGTALDRLARILEADPDNVRWHEMAAQALVDSKRFDDAVARFNRALDLTPDGAPVITARLRAGRALAYEGLSRWQQALDDYEAALDLAQQGGESPDAYIINSIGNCRASLAQWGEAREAYLTSSQLFQQAKGFRGRGGSTTARLDGAIYAASNAALMLAQLGDEAGALKEFENISRRAPGSSDSRAALAALYWHQGRGEAAEASWQYACDNVASGCRKYTDIDWVGRIRRWPPVMVARLQAFLTLQQREAQAASAS